MAKIFKKQQEVNEHPKRNNFDLSFQNHLTMKMGVLYPVFCKEVVPGDSFRINSAFGLKFMPLAFPVQSRMRAEMKFFFVRNKNLWNRWEDWLSGLKTSKDNVIHPYISQPESFFRTGTLADYLNVPSTLAVAEGGSVFQSCYFPRVAYNPTEGQYNLYSLTVQAPNFSDVYPNHLPANYSGVPAAGMQPIYETQVAAGYTYDRCFADPIRRGSAFGVVFDFSSRILSQRGTFSVPFSGSFAQDSGACYLRILSRAAGQTDIAYWDVRGQSSDARAHLSDGNIVIDYDTALVNDWNELISLGKECAFLLVVPYSFKPEGDTIEFAIDQHCVASFDSSSIKDGDFRTPFSKEADVIRINALPFRAYESVYNAYYRNSVNQPFYVNGDIEYNRYNTTLEGGPDVTPYELKRRNYELDFLTSALPSPQQGNAPLVGLSALGNVTIEDESGITTAKAEIADDGTIVGLNVTSPIASQEHALTLNQIASAGFSINDFRNTNALQRWLEVNIRKGYRYIDFITGHFGKSPEYRELDMPEFIGGFSRDVNVSQIVSTSDTLMNGGKGLGSFQGMANCFGGSRHSITHYCDDYGFIIGILCVVPTPAYSQLLPKHFLKQSPLDYYFPEFAQLGMQPITYEEVCPVQTYNQSLSDHNVSLLDTFGYQRPNYDLVSNVDEIHGNFRGDLHQFLINRVFGSRPVLGNDFLTIDPDETNQIFVDQQPDGDNIVGQVVFDVKAKRPIPRVVIPSLGR